MSEEFTQEEIKVLKEIAQEKISFNKIFCCDEDGKEYPYKNRYSQENQEVQDELPVTNCPLRQEVQE